MMNKTQEFKFLMFRDLDNITMNNNYKFGWESHSRNKGKSIVPSGKISLQYQEFKFLVIKPRIATRIYYKQMSLQGKNIVTSGNHKRLSREIIIFKSPFHKQKGQISPASEFNNLNKINLNQSKNT